MSIHDKSHAREGRGAANGGKAWVEAPMWAGKHKESEVVKRCKGEDGQIDMLKLQCELNPEMTPEQLQRAKIRALYGARY